jgi:hypothetical protein
MVAQASLVARPLDAGIVEGRSGVAAPIIGETIRQEDKTMRPSAYLTFAFLIAAITIGSIAESAVNCGEVIRSLKAGASPRQVADTMAISMSDVKDCQDRAEVESADQRQEGWDDARKKRLR